MRQAQREREFTEFYAGGAAALRRTAYVVVRDWELAEDLVQQALTKVYVAWARVRPETRMAYARRSVLANGSYLECTVDTTPRGYVVIRRLEALEPFRGAQDGTWMLVPASELGRADPDKLWFEQGVKVIKSETLVTVANERVHAPTLEAAQAAFATPVADLVEIGADPLLVIPEPPTDDSGCGPWTLDDGVTVVCESSESTPASSPGTTP